MGLDTRAIAFYRVSSKSQAISHLGLDAQEADVKRYAAHHGLEIVASFTEVESGKRRSADRPQLLAALEEARALQAKLIVAKLDRMGRRRADLLSLIDHSGITVAFADEPNASNLSIGIKAIVADEEGKAISARTIAALAAARRRGVKLGNPNGVKNLVVYREKHGNAAAIEGATRAADDFAETVRPLVERLLHKGLSDAQLAAALNEKQVPTPREGGSWHRTSARLLRVRLSKKNQDGQGPKPPRE